MIEMKLDANSQTLFVDYLKQFIQDNPILLQNIIEPCINEMISDTDIPDHIKDKVNSAIVCYFTSNPMDAQIKDAFSECIVSAFSETYGEDFTKRMVTEWFESNPPTDVIHEVARDYVNEMDHDVDINDAINDRVIDAVNDEIDPTTIQEQAREQIDELIRDSLRESRIDSALEEAVENKVESHMEDSGHEMIRDKIRELMGTDEFLDILKEEVRVVAKSETQEQLEQATTVIDKDDEWKSVHIEVRPDIEIEFINTLKIFMSDRVRIVNPKEITQ